jgi:hypothetical protein
MLPPTLDDLHRATPWLWLNCERCQHHAPLACAVAVIRWGATCRANKLDRSGVPYGRGPPITLIVAAKDGVDTSSLQATLGNRDIKDTTRYTALAPDRCKGSNEIKVGSTVPTRARRTLNRRAFSSRASL